jgi:hypothetical protein
MKLVFLLILIIILLVLLKHKTETFSNNKDMAVLIHTFDGYSRYWEPLLHFTNKYLNIDYDIYIGVENMDIPPEILGKVKILKSGEGTFVDRLESHLNKLEKKGYKYIYLMQEDHWYTKPTSFGVKHNEIFKEGLKLMKSDNIDCLKLHVLSMHPFDTKLVERYKNKLLNNPLYYLNTHYGEKKNLNIAHNGCIVTMKLMKHSCKVTKLKGYKTAKGHEYATVSEEFGKIKRNSNDKGWLILQCNRNKPLLEYNHVGIRGSLTDIGEKVIIKEGKKDWIKKINLKENQIRKRQETK